MEPVTLTLLFGGGLLLFSKKKSGSPSSSTSVTYDQKMTHTQRAAMMMQVRKMAAYTSDRYGISPYMADFMTIVGFLESNFNPTAVNPEIKRNPANAARGLFGMRPETAFARSGSSSIKSLVRKPNTLLDPRWAFVTAVDHAMQADKRSREVTGREADWMAVRRWWACPSLVHDYDEVKEIKGCPASSDVRRRFENGVESVNKHYGADINEDFIWMPVQGGGYPGVQSLMKDFGLKA